MGKSATPPIVLGASEQPASIRPERRVTASHVFLDFNIGLIAILVAALVGQQPRQAKAAMAGRSFFCPSSPS
jgi:hypothetical protein